MYISCFRPGGSRFPKEAKSFQGNLCTGELTVVGLATPLSITSAKAFLDYRDEQGPAAIPRAPLPMGMIIHLLKSNYTCMARAGPLSHTLQIVLVAGTVKGHPGADPG